MSNLRTSLIGLGAVALVTFTNSAHAQFEVQRDGFPFQNYTNESNPVNLTSAEVWRMFGDAVCATGSGEQCRLTPQAQRWMQQTSESMNGGHCEGMAVMSLRLFTGDDDPGNYVQGATSTGELTLDGNEQLQREIGYWFALQGVAPVSSAEQRVAPSQIVELLNTSFSGSGPVYTLGFYKRGFREGHAVTPIRIESVDQDVVNIIIYDNNFPNQERALEVNIAQETWSYSAAASPDVPESLYEGDAQSGTLGITPLAVRTGALQCPFCGNYQKGNPAARTLNVTGDASLLISNELGDELGHREDGSFVNEIEGATFAPQRSADLWADRAEPSYTVPGGDELEVIISDAGEDFAGGYSSFEVLGVGYYLGIDNIILDPQQEDSALIGADEAAITYITSGRETPDIVIGAQTEAADWTVVLRSRGDSSGQVIEAAVDFEGGGVLDFAFDGSDDNSEFDMFIERIDDNGVFEFGHEMIPVPNGAVLSLFFGDFDADGEELVLQIDADGDGNVDDSVNLVDDADMPQGPPPVPQDPQNPGTNDSGGCSTNGAQPASTLLIFILLAGALFWRRRA